jgi:periplasmic protein CpxP/Spy
MKQVIVKRMLVVATLMLFLPVAAWAAPGEGPQRGWGEGKRSAKGACLQGDGERQLGRMATTLQLTDTQREQVGAILAAEREQAAPLAMQMQQERQALRASIHSGSAQEADIRAQVAAQAQHKAELMVLRAAAQNQIHALLTPEQQVLMAKGVEHRSSGGKGCKNRCCEDGGKTGR